MRPALLTQQQLIAVLREELGLHVASDRIHTWIREGMPTAPRGGAKKPRFVWERVRDWVMGPAAPAPQPDPATKAPVVPPMPKKKAPAGDPEVGRVMVRSGAKQRAKPVRRNGLFKRPNGSYMLRKKIGGHLYQVSLVVTERDDAREVYNKVLKEIVLGLHGLPKPPTLEATIEEWCRLHRKQEAHVRAARWAAEALGNLVRLPLTSISTVRLEEWISDYQEEHAPATVNQVLRYLKAWLRWSMDRDAIHRMPCRIKMQRVVPRVRPVVGIARHDAFLQGVDCVKTWTKHSQLAELPVRAAVRFMLGLGLREAEVLGAKWEWLSLDARTYTVGKSKGGRPRVLGVPDWVLPWLDALPRTASGWIFPDGAGHPHQHNWLLRALARGARVAGINGRLGNHRLRASFATRHAAAGTPLVDIQALLGHTSITTTRGYVEEEQDRLNTAQHRLAERLKKG
jgi:integrase